MLFDPNTQAGNASVKFYHGDGESRTAWLDVDACLFTSCGLAWSTVSEYISMLHFLSSEAGLLS